MKSFIIFLLDQSALMSRNDGQKAAEIVHSAIWDILSACTFGTEVKDRAYITIIGYGRGGTASIIKEGWISQWIEDLKNVRKNGALLIPITKGGSCPMNGGIYSG